MRAITHHLQRIGRFCRAGFDAECVAETESYLENLEQRLVALETALRAPRPTFDVCDGRHVGHPCADPECWVLVRYKEQHNDRS